MAHFTVVMTAPLTAPEAWERVLDLHAHGEVIPFTSLRPIPGREHNPDDRQPDTLDREDDRRGREDDPIDREDDRRGREDDPIDREHALSERGATFPMSAHDLRAGSRFVARTAWGPVGFDDAMVVESLRAPTLTSPGFARIRKEGTAIRGWIDLTISAEGKGKGKGKGNGTGTGTGTGTGRARITWSQVICVRWVPCLFDPLVAACARAAYGTALRRLLDRH